MSSRHITHTISQKKYPVFKYPADSLTFETINVAKPGSKQPHNAKTYIASILINNTLLEIKVQKLSLGLYLFKR